MTYVSSGCKELKRKYPITSGIVAGTTKQEGRITNLIAQGVNNQKSIVYQKEKEGFE
jgi:hypothetical protein